MAIETKGVLAYLLIAFGLAWSYELGALLLGLSLTNPAVQIPVAFFPAVSAVVVRRWISGEGFRDAGMSPRLKSKWTYYLVASIWPVAAISVVAVLATASGLVRPDFFSALGALFGPRLPFWTVIPLLMGVSVLTMPLFWGEEFGWRSYLQPRLWGDRPLLGAATTGLIWGVWHYPLAFTGYSDNPNIALALLLDFTAYNVLLSIVLAWFRLRSGSVWPCFLAHAGSNVVVGTLAGVMLVQGQRLDPSVVSLLLLVPLAVFSAWIVLGGRLKAGRPADEKSPQPSSFQKGTEV